MQSHVTSTHPASSVSNKPSASAATITVSASGFGGWARDRLQPRTRRARMQLPRAGRLPTLDESGPRRPAADGCRRLAGFPRVTRGRDTTLSCGQSVVSKPMHNIPFRNSWSSGWCISRTERGAHFAQSYTWRLYRALLATMREPLKEGLAGDGGVEPPRTDPESAVLPLDESPTLESQTSTGGCRDSSRARAWQTKRPRKERGRLAAPGRPGAVGRGWPYRLM